MKTNNILIWYALVILIGMSASCQKINFDNNINDETSSTGNMTMLISTPPEIKPLPVVLDTEWNAHILGYKPGDHTQHMQGIAYSESDPSRIYMGQDVSNVWVSTNFGADWSSLKCEGLGSSFVTSIEVDPVDKNRILASVNCRTYASINENYQGIYLSTNGGVNWTMAGGGHRTSLAAVRSSTKLLAYAPTSKNGTMAMRWYAAFGEGDSVKNEDGILVPSTADDGFLTSNDGGASWTEVRKLPEATFGKDICGIKVNKVNANQVFLYGDGGLFKLTNATSPSGTVYKISGATGSNKLPGGAIKGALYQSNNGDTLIVAVVDQGIYKSNNGGTDWHSIYSSNDLTYCYVNEKHAEHIYAIPRTNNAQIKISDDGGSNWWSPVTADVKYRLGYETAWNNKLGGQFAYVLSHPNDPEKIFMHSKSKNYKSTNGGHNWTYSDNGYNAASHSSLNEDQMFDRNNAKRFCYFMVDRGAVVTTEKGKWFKNFAKPIGAGQTCIGGAVQTGTQVMLATVGDNGTGKLLRTTDNGDSWTIVRSESKNRWVVGFNLQKKNVCYQWRERSDNNGETWSPMNSMPTAAVLCGISINNGDIIYAMKLESEGNTKKIYRSTNQGIDGSWESNPIINATWDLTVPGKSSQFVFKVHPTDDNIVYTSSANGEITKWDLSTSPATPTDLDVIVGSSAPGLNYIHRFAIDPERPEVMYAINQRVNTGKKFFRSIDGGQNWENLSEYVPQGSLNGLAVSPVSGEVYVSGENGSFVMLPPYGTTNTASSVVPYTMHHITTFPY